MTVVLLLFDVVVVTATCAGMGVMWRRWRREDRLRDRDRTDLREAHR